MAILRIQATQATPHPTVLSCWRPDACSTEQHIAAACDRRYISEYECVWLRCWVSVSASMMRAHSIHLMAMKWCSKSTRCSQSSVNNHNVFTVVWCAMCCGSYINDLQKARVSKSSGGVTSLVTSDDASLMMMSNSESVFRSTKASCWLL